MHFIYLADRPEAISTIAHWFYGAWGNRLTDSSVAAIEQELTLALNRDQAPLFILAIEDNTLLGVAGLKIREMAAYPQFEYWLGGVYVPDEFRGRKIASQLADRIATHAAAMGIQQLYLQTDHQAGGLYTQLGWQPIESVTINMQEVLVMMRHLTNP
jgi:GNAT superfamily N-acetyltransferase